MVKLITLIRRPALYSQEEFHAHWLEYHAQLGRHIRPMRRYVQYHTLADDPCRTVMDQAGQSQEEPFDGAAVGWFDSAEAMQADMKDNPNTLAALEDMAFLIDPTRTVPTLTEEKVIIEPEGSVPYVLIGGLRRNPDMERDQFQEAWLRHADSGLRGYDQGQLRGYIQNHTLLDEAGTVAEVGAGLDFF